MQMHQNNPQQFGTIVHPSIIKTNNLMMDSILSNMNSTKGSTSENQYLSGQKKLGMNGNLTNHMAYNSAGPRDSIDNRGKTSINIEKTPQSAINTRNWRNKSIDNTPDTTNS